MVQLLLYPFQRRFGGTAEIGGDDLQIVCPQRRFRLARQSPEDVADSAAFFRGPFALEGEDTGHQEHGDTAPFLFIWRFEIRLEETAHQGGRYIELAGQISVLSVQNGLPESDSHILDGFAACFENFFEGGAVFLQATTAAVIEGQKAADAPRDDGKIFRAASPGVFGPRRPHSGRRAAWPPGWVRRELLPESRRRFRHKAGTRRRQAHPP